MPTHEGRHATFLENTVASGEGSVDGLHLYYPDKICPELVPDQVKVRCESGVLANLH